MHFLLFLSFCFGWVSNFPCNHSCRWLKKSISMWIVVESGRCRAFYEYRCGQFATNFNIEQEYSHFVSISDILTWTNNHWTRSCFCSWISDETESEIQFYELLKSEGEEWKKDDFELGALLSKLSQVGMLIQNAKTKYVRSFQTISLWYLSWTVEFVILT
jgi:hypothetical protein